MDAVPGLQGAEVAQLRACLNDLVSAIALPALWPAGDADRIVSTVVDALMGMLRLTFAFVRLNDPHDGRPTDRVRFAGAVEGTALARRIGQAIHASLPAPPDAPIPLSDGDVHVASAPLGLQAGIGIVIVGSRRRDFPLQTERVLLDVAANQAAVGLQQAYLLAEQKRVARDLDERVGRRTSELATANDQLRREMAERKRAEARLQRAHDSFAEAQRLSKTGSFITDLAADEHEWSDEACRIFEFDLGTPVTMQRVREAVHPGDLPAFDSTMAGGARGENVDFAFRVRTARGAVKHVRGVAHVVEQVEGRPMLVGALQDVTETMLAEEGLNLARSELARISQAMSLGTLTASMAHELNQPLSGIITNASTCLRMLSGDRPNVDGARETAKRTIRDGNRASDVITRLRKLYTRKEFTLEFLDLNETVQEVIALSLSELQRHRIVLQSDFADHLPRVPGDRVQLQQVIMNLLRNASDAMDGVDDRPRRLLVRTELAPGDGVRVTVRDSGVGIDHQLIGRLFNPFFTTKPTGMGIGLSISRAIIETHRGRLWAAPNPDHGATFAFSIPADPLAPAMSGGSPARQPIPRYDGQSGAAGR